MTTKSTSCWLVFLGLTAAFAKGDFDSGSDGSDGAFNPTQSVEIDLGLAATGTWNTPSPVPGQGVYDPQQWAVVFKYTTIDIPAGVTVTFKNHPSGAPVMWLTMGDVTIAGIVNLNGQDGHSPGVAPYYAEPGPGGFSGAIVGYSGGFGPGGGQAWAQNQLGGGGSYRSVGNGPAGQVYGNSQLIPLIGGSGGSRGTSGNSYGGGAGGGAILVASNSQITLLGQINASGGNVNTGAFYGGGAGGGSGGSIRIVTPVISGNGSISSSGGSGGSSGGQLGGSGGVRIETETNLYAGNTSPAYSLGFPSSPFPAQDRPTLKVMAVNGQTVPDDPTRGILTPDLDIDSSDPVTIEIVATNIPVGVTVNVLAIPRSGAMIPAVSSPLVDSGAGLLTATATLALPQGPSEIQLRANW